MAQGDARPGGIAVIDIGKTTLKLVVVDAKGAVLHAETRTGRSEPEPPYPHFPLAAIWAWLLEALARVPDRERIEAIVPVTHGCAAVLMAGDEPALPALDYEHDGPEAVSARYGELAGAFEETYTPHLPVGFNLGRQLLWQETAFAQAFARVSDILTYPQYWAWRLSGVKAAEITSLACHNHLWNPRARSFSGLVERCGWRRLMPPLRPAWESLGPILPELSAATGLDPAARVLCGIHDSNASFAVHRARRRAPFTVLSTGTWIIMMAGGGSLERLDPSRDTLAYTDLMGEPVPTARFMAGREFAAIAGEAGLKAVASPAEAMRLVSRGSMALPSFAPFAGPFIGRRGGFAGPPPETPAERAALAALYCALVSDLSLGIIDARGDLLVDGPFAGNPVYLGALAALRPGQRVLASTAGGGPAEGAALLATWPTPAGEGARYLPAEPLGDLDAYRAAWRRLVAA